MRMTGDREFYQERGLMKKIVLLSSEPAGHEQLITMVAHVFPECTVEIVSSSTEGFSILPDSLDNPGNGGPGTTIYREE